MTKHIGDESAVMNDWASELEKLTNQQVETPPEGWETSVNIAKKLGISRWSATRMLQKIPVERKKFMSMTTRGLYPVVHYRLKK